MKLAPLYLPLTALTVLSVGFSAFSANPSTAAKPKPLKILLVAGGCCHDYDTQTKLIAAGLSKRAHVEVETVYNPDKSTKPHFEIYEKADWYKDYDVVIHDECAADVKDQGFLGNILKAHQEGVPAVTLHCAMHSFRVGNVREPITPGSEGSEWFDLLGLQSSGHGPQEPIQIEFTNSNHPITKGLKGWTTIKEELYNNVQDPKNYPNHQTLAVGKQEYVDKKTGEKKKGEAVVAWTNLYGPKKTPIFSTTIGHNNETYEDDRYMDFITRGLLWSVGKLGEDGKPVAGYEAN